MFFVFYLFEKHVGLYEKNAELDYEQVLSEVEALGEPTGLSPYTLHLLLLILMTPHLHARYRAAGISEDIFHDTVSDLKWKLAECKRLFLCPKSFRGLSKERGGIQALSEL